MQNCFLSNASRHLISCSQIQTRRKIRSPANTEMFTGLCSNPRKLQANKTAAYYIYTQKNSCKGKKMKIKIEQEEEVLPKSKEKRAYLTSVSPIANSELLVASRFLVQKLQMQGSSLSLFLLLFYATSRPISLPESFKAKKASQKLSFSLSLANTSCSKRDSERSERESERAARKCKARISLPSVTPSRYDIPLQTSPFCTLSAY